MVRAFNLACLIAYCTAFANWKYAGSITQVPCSNNKSCSPAPPVSPESRHRHLSSPGTIEGGGPSLFGYTVDNALQHATCSRSGHSSKFVQACHSDTRPGTSAGTAASRFNLLESVHHFSTLVADRRLPPCRTAAESTLLSRRSIQAQPAKPLHLGPVLQVYTRPSASTGTAASRFNLLEFVHHFSTLVAARRSPPCRTAAESTLLSRQSTQAQPAKPLHLGQVLQVWTRPSLRCVSCAWSP